MNDEYDAEGLRQFLRILRGIQQDRAIAHAELALLDTLNHTPCPMPDEAHPSLTAHAEFVRQWPSRDAVRVPVYRQAAWAVEGQCGPTVDSTLSTITLTSRKVCAPAPFVARSPGDDAMYVWRAWTDGSSRYITTTAELAWR